MGFSDSIRQNMPGAPSSIAKHMLKNYFEAKTRYPHFSEEQIFSKILTHRYAVNKGMSVDDIERVLSQTDTLVELTMALVEHENPIAMSETYREETARDIITFFVENETVEFEKFRQRVESGNAEENNQADAYLIDDSLAAGDEAPGKEDLRQMLDSNIVCPCCRADYPPEAVMPDEKELSETSSEPVNADVFTENSKNRETSQSTNDQENNHLISPGCNKSLRIDKSFVAGVTSVVVVMAVILLANFVKTELTQDQSNFDPSPQLQMTLNEARKQKYYNPITNWIEQKHGSEKVEDTYIAGYERGLSLIRKLATNDDAKINMLCDEAMKTDHIVNFSYLKGCVNGYKSYFAYWQKYYE